MYITLRFYRLKRFRISDFSTLCRICSCQQLTSSLSSLGRPSRNKQICHFQPTCLASATFCAPSPCNNATCQWLSHTSTAFTVKTFSSFLNFSLKLKVQKSGTLLSRTPALAASIFCQRSRKIGRFEFFPNLRSSPLTSFLFSFFIWSFREKPRRGINRGLTRYTNLLSLQLKA